MVIALKNGRQIKKCRCKKLNLNVILVRRIKYLERKYWAWFIQITKDHPLQSKVLPLQTPTILLLTKSLLKHKHKHKYKYIDNDDANTQKYKKYEIHSHVTIKMQTHKCFQPRFGCNLDQMIARLSEVRWSF